MSAGRLLLKLELGLGIQQEQLLGGLSLAGGIVRGGGLGLGLYRSQNLGPRSLCIHNFSIIDVRRL